MAEVTVPLSKSGVNGLVKRLRAFAAELRDDIPTDIEWATCADVADEVRSNIASLTDVDGNYLGTDNPNASVSVEVGLRGHDAIWRGEQIAYVEFGTGAPGAANPYPGPAMGMAGYAPDPTKDQWWYLDAKIGPWVSLGLTPQAPMYHASKVAESQLKIRAAERLKQGLRAIAV